MSEHGLVAKGTHKYYRYQVNKTSYAEKENILNQVVASILRQDSLFIPIEGHSIPLTAFNLCAFGMAFDKA